jgi:hypothetical protein
MPNMHGHPPKAVPQACQAKGPSMVMMTTPHAQLLLKATVKASFEDEKPASHNCCCTIDVTTGQPG